MDLAWSSENGLRTVTTTCLNRSNRKRSTREDRRRSWSFVLLASFLASCWCLVDVVQSDITLPLNSIQKWAETFGQTIYATSARATALTDIQTDYLLMYVQVRPQNGSQLIHELKEKLEEMFNRKVRAVNRLVEVAEKSFANHTMRDKLQVTYPKAKNLTNLELVEEEHFYDLPVNLTNSSIHVPTNVYDESVAVLNGVLWSAALDKTFQENYRNDPSLSWQYFGSSTGFFRNYPGIRWPKADDEVDLYDCRTRGWYIQAATSPKDMVILLDSSGSMKGLRMEIAKATVKKIVETLSDDDFFNVIKFSEMPEYLAPCFNGTLVQATTNNRKKITETLNAGIKTHNIAYFDKALTEAFELLRSMNSTNQGSKCNKAIMIITDGAPDTYEQIFRYYNWPDKNVRVFTYLIGREVGDPRHVRWMACSNKGYYSHISTLADVHEHVQEYIHVISRPMVIMRANQTVWTNIYRDTSHSDKGIYMTISVAQPVYNINNGTANSGDLLGVMGTDVPLKEIISQIPHHKLGVNGYAFAITNNGYVLFHPDLRPHDKRDVKPNYNSVDLSEVELIDTPPNQLKEATTYKREMKLRNRMIDRETGKMQMRMKVHLDDMKRATTRLYNYFFTPIDNTPFSLGIALPEGYGMSWIDGTRSLPYADLSDFRTSEMSITLADWVYCRPQNVNDSRLPPFEFLMKSLERGKQDPDYLQAYCDIDLVNSLLFDAEATRGVPNSWRKENTDGTFTDSSSKKNGVELVFIATKGGLTRYLSLVDNLTDPNFITMNKDTVRELYYSRALEGGEGVFTFSVPFPEEKRRVDVNSTVVTASTPIFISSVGGEEAVAVAAVTGLQMQYAKFHEFVLSATSTCINSEGASCNITCDSEVIDCYLLDNNGFVIFSENPDEHLGRFFGEIDGLVMAKLIREDNKTDNNQSDGVFSRIEIIDYQGMCSVWRKAHCSARSIFVDPLRNLLLALWWILQRLIMCLVSFGEFIWCTDEMTMTTGNVSFADSEYEWVPDFSRLYEIANNNTELVREWLNEWRKLTLASKPTADLRSWYQGILDIYAPQIIGFKPCITSATLYEAQPNVVHNTVPKCRTPPSAGCNKSFSLVPVYRTNLMLLVVDATCTCDSGDKISLQPVELDPSPGDHEACATTEKGERESCLKLQSDVYRRRPVSCYFSHKQENATRCGGPSHVYPLSVFNFSILLILSVSVSVGPH